MDVNVDVTEFAATCTLVRVATAVDVIGRFWMNDVIDGVLAVVDDVIVSVDDVVVVVVVILF